MKDLKKARELIAESNEIEVDNPLSLSLKLSFNVKTLQALYRLARDVRIGKRLPKNETVLALEVLTDGRVKISSELEPAFEATLWNVHEPLEDAA